MNQQLSDALNQAIADNLPEQTAGELRKYLENAAALKNEVEYYKEKEEYYREEYSNREEEIGRLQRLELRKDDINERRKVLEADISKFRNSVEQHETIITMRENHADEKVTLMRDLIGVGLHSGSFCATNCQTGCAYEGGETAE